MVLPAGAIPCPSCGGDPILTCSCDGQSSDCTYCLGAQLPLCECEAGVIQRPSYCPLCYLDDLVSSVEPIVRWAEHPVFDRVDLDYYHQLGRLKLDECERALCEDCHAACTGWSP